MTCDLVSLREVFLETMSLLVLGTVALDNVKTPWGERRDLLGGSATHFAMSARLFTQVNLVAVIGKDFPKKHIDFLNRKGINLASVIEGRGKTFRWDGEYKKEDMNTALTLATELGVLVGFTPLVSQAQKGVPNIFLANIDPDIQMGLLKTMRTPKLVGLDSMNLWIQHKRASLLKLMKKVDLFVANEGEARALTGEHNLIQAAKMLRRLGPRLVIVKKGEHGVFFFSDRYQFSFPAYPVAKVVDPTGAGDTFAGAVMGYLSKVGKINERTLKTAVIYGTTLASFTVEGFGTAKTAALSLPVVHKRMKKLIKLISY